MQGQKHNAKKKQVKNAKKCKGKNTVQKTQINNAKKSAETQRKTMQIKNAENAGANQKSGRQKRKQIWTPCNMKEVGPSKVNVENDKQSKT